MANSTPKEPLDTYLDRRADQVTRALDAWLTVADDASSDLYDAMRYMVLGGGKKIRPVLILAACEACGGSDEAAMPAALAVEMVHTYSLIHDDLPAMDDDDLRHGRFSCHKAFGEALAILAGDALLTEAFAVIATEVADSAVAKRLVAELARAAGALGMAGGQVADLAAESARSDDARLVEVIHQRKTASLIAASVVMGALCAKAPDDRVDALREYGLHLGLAFQVTDDILDAEGTTETLGKTVGKDKAAGKLTYVTCHGVEAARRRARQEADRAVAALDAFGPEADRLRQVARFVVERTH